MKQPIEQKDIRVGDLIRAEYPSNGTTSGYRAVEYRASDPDIPIEELEHEPEPHRLGVVASYYLLDRPEPPYELPTEPGMYTIADSTDDIYRKRVFKFSGWESWMENEETWSNRDNMEVRDFLLKQKWSLKRLVIEG